MGQAAIDLPDPLNPPPAAESAVNTDDLLAQMAGEEIDRLLAETEVERPAKPGSPVAARDAVPSPSPQSTPAAPQAETKVSEADALKGVLGGIAPASDAGPDPVAKLAAPPQASPDVKSTAELLDEELAADEARAALNAAKFQDKPESATSEPASAVPFPLNVLAWISTPLDACPDHVREAIGKIAIITLVNAVAVLFYVLFLRPHHG
jgi:hypothetical protein